MVIQSFNPTLSEIKIGSEIILTYFLQGSYILQGLRNNIIKKRGYLEGVNNSNPH
jgi:hypothetical protein